MARELRHRIRQHGCFCGKWACVGPRSGQNVCRIYVAGVHRIAHHFSERAWWMLRPNAGKVGYLLDEISSQEIPGAKDAFVSQCPAEGPKRQTEPGVKRPLWAPIACWHKHCHNDMHA